MKKLIMTATLLCFLNLGWALAPKTVFLKNETANFVWQIKYPQGFADKKIDQHVRDLIVQLRKKAEPQKNAKAEKKSLYIDYQIKFHNQHALSVLFSISTYTQGAAHPLNEIKTLNFLNGKCLTFDQLFRPNSNYLAKIAAVSRNLLVKKNIFDNDWVSEGTKATTANYKNWLFTKKGLMIVFETYQVAAYVYGPQQVEILKTQLMPLIKPEIKPVWSNP